MNKTREEQRRRTLSTPLADHDRPVKWQLEEIRRLLVESVALQQETLAVLKEIRDSTRPVVIGTKSETARWLNSMSEFDSRPSLLEMKEMSK